MTDATATIAMLQESKEKSEKGFWEEKFPGDKVRIPVFWCEEGVPQSSKSSHGLRLDVSPSICPPLTRVRIRYEYAQRSRRRWD